MFSKKWLQWYLSHPSRSSYFDMPHQEVVLMLCPTEVRQTFVSAPAMEYTESGSDFQS